MFDWKTYLYDFIPEDQTEIANEMLMKALSTDKWKHRIQKRGVAFFLIVKHWAIRISNTLVSKSINWKDVPGYRTVLKAILIELKERETHNYPEALIDATCALLANEKLLNIFVTIIFNKTCAYDT